VGTY